MKRQILFNSMIIMIMVVVGGLVTSCDNSDDFCVSKQTSQLEQPVDLESSCFTTRAVNPCSYPFSATWVYNKDGIQSGTVYKLLASQTTDKKWRCRSSTSTGKDGTKYRRFKMTVTNNHYSYPIVFRAVGVKKGILLDNSYTLIAGCYEVGPGESQTIRFDKESPLYGPGTGGRLYDRVYDKVDWEVIVKNGNEVGLTATTVPISVSLSSWFNEEP